MKDVNIRVIELQDHVLSMYDRQISAFTKKEFDRCADASHVHGTSCCPAPLQAFGSSCSNFCLFTTAPWCRLNAGNAVSSAVDGGGGLDSVGCGGDI